MNGRPVWRASVAEADVALADPGADRAYYLLRGGSMRAGIYAPRGSDLQEPHDQDELYIVRSGTGVMVKDGVKVQVAPGDLLFVEAGAVHRFETFSDDFQTWVVFWGAPGGEGAGA